MAFGSEELTLGGTQAIAPATPSPKLAARFEPHLYAGERLVWAARPRRPFSVGDLQASNAILPLVLSIPALGYGFLTLQPWFIAGALGGFAVVAGLYWISPPTTNVGRQIYALTDRRALILQDPPDDMQVGAMRSSLADPMVEELISIDLATLTAVTAETRPRRLAFSPRPVHEVFQRWGLPTPSAFAGLPRQTQVLALIEQQREVARRLHR